jgi:secondary thiamine-phosphate synthase enzyme
MEFQIQTKRKVELIDITEKVREMVHRSKTTSGICLVYAPHATAAITINEFEPNIAADFETIFEHLIPKADYQHNMIDDNAEAHLRSSLFGCGKSIPIENGELVLGTWQRIIFCEFDGPRNRRINVSIAKG